MSAKSWSSRGALWVAVFALLLKSAVPMFAARAASLQGVPVAQICTVYGVALPEAGTLDHHAGHEHGAHSAHAGHAAHGDHHDHSSHERGAHAGEHCALTALVAFASYDPEPLSLPAPQAVHGIEPAQASTWTPRVAWTSAQPRAPPSV